MPIYTCTFSPKCYAKPDLPNLRPDPAGFEGPQTPLKRECALVRFPATLILCALVFGLATSVGYAQPADSGEALEQVESKIEAAEYDEAIAIAETLLDRPRLTAAQRNRGLALLAVAHIAHRDLEQAQPVLRELFARDPGFQLGEEASPPVQDAFQQVRASSVSPLAIRLEHGPSQNAGRTVPIRLRISSGVDAVHAVQIWHRMAGAPNYAATTLPLTDEGEGGLEIPVLSPGQMVEYYIEVTAPSGAVIASLASAERPLAVSTSTEGTPETMGVAEAEPSASEPGEPSAGGHRVGEPSASGSIATKWWFWTILGVVVAGAATVGIYFATQPSPANGTLGSISL